MTEQSALPLRATGPLAVVNWWYPDGSTIVSCPLQLPVAEAVARAYVERFPERTSWLSVPAPLATRSRRRRR
jgi:hypothetical protein